MRKFCFECGRKTDELSGGKCTECAKKSVFVELPKRMEIIQCGKCKKALMRNKWVDFNLEKIVESFAKVNGRAGKIEAELDRKKLKAVFSLVPRSSEKEIKETHEAVFHINRIICPTCSRRHSGYYEGVLQLRGFAEDDLEAMRGVFCEIEKKSFLRIKEVDGGFDVKVGNKLVMDSAAKKIRAKFPSEIKKSAKIVTKIDGRDVHRKYILIRKAEGRK